MKYTINLVREIRLAEKKQEAKRARTFSIAMVCFAILALSLFYSALEALRMQSIIRYEKKKLRKIEAEYRKYKSTRMIVDKADLELLDRLQSNRIFWTKKLAAMALHLPGNYWITKFRYTGDAFEANGYGYISRKQKQLIVLNKYFNNLRGDSTYNDVFKDTRFISTERQDDEGRRRVSFEFSSAKKAKKSP